MTALNIETVFNEVEEYYSHEIISRAKDLLYHQNHKYQYLFT